MLSQKHTISKWPNRTIEQVRSATGGQLSTADVLELLDMADGDVNRAVNMYLNKPGKVREICIIVHVGGTRCVTSSTDHYMKIHARITLFVEFIRTCIFLFLFYV